MEFERTWRQEFRYSPMNSKPFLLTGSNTPDAKNNIRPSTEFVKKEEKKKPVPQSTYCRDTGLNEG
jgi:hypothetical protein